MFNKALFWGVLLSQLLMLGEHVTAQVDSRFDLISDEQYQELKGFLLDSQGVLTQKWGDKGGPFAYTGCKDKSLIGLHAGVDYGATEGTAVFAGVTGEVIAVSSGISPKIPGCDQKEKNPLTCLSKVIIYNEEAKISFIYLHLETINVKEGFHITDPKQQIGTAGMRGRATGPHLHFEARPGKTRFSADCIEDTINPFEAVMKARGLQSPVSRQLTISVSTKEETNEESCRFRPPRVDPPAQLAIRKKLIENGFRVVRGTDISIEGEGFAECVEFDDDLWQARARLEVNVIENSSGRILASEALHAGGVDPAPNLAAKRALQKAGERMGECIVKKLKQGWATPCRFQLEIGVNNFETEVPTDGWGASRGMKEMVEKSLSKRGVQVVVPVAADTVISGRITDYRVIYQLDIPILNLLFRIGAAYMTVEPQVFNLQTAQIERGDAITDFAGGIEILGFRFGFGPQAVAKKISNRIADWVEFKVK